MSPIDPAPDVPGEHDVADAGSVGPESAAGDPAAGDPAAADPAAAGPAAGDPAAADPAVADPAAADPAAGGPAAIEAEVFPPTLREVMLRPAWLGLLALCLVVAGVFAWLGQWQLERAIDTDPPPAGATEQVQPLAEVAGPGENIPEPVVGQRVETEGRWVAGDFIVVQSRFNDGVEGYWVTGQLRLEGADEPTSVAVAIGWAATEDAAQQAVEQLEADAAASALHTITGRLISDEGPTLPPRDADPQTLTRMSTAALLGQWHDIDELNVYRPYIASVEPLAGLEAIASPAPEQQSAVNWLNIFYAIEWAVFAGFAFYLWYRLARDQWEKEVEDLEDAAAEA